MPKQENTAINDLISLVSRKSIAEIDEPALFSTSPPAARLRPAPFGGSLSPIGATVAPLPRRRAPAATPPQVPVGYSDYADDAATTIDPPASWGAVAPVVRHADTGPFAPPPLPQPPYVPPAAIGYAYPVRPAYPPPHQPPAYYQAPYAEHLDTMRVRALPLETDVSPARALAREVLETMVKLWIPFAALGVIAVVLAGYRLLRDDDRPAPQEPEAAIVMTAEPAEPAPVLAEAAVAEPVVAEPPAADADGVPEDSLWQPTRPQPTIAPRVETDIEPVAEVKPSARPNKDRSSSRRAAKRAAAKRAKQIALAELAPTKRAKPTKADPRETKVVAIAAAKPMKIGATTVAAKGGGGAGKLTVASTPTTLIYVDGRNTGMMTPRTLSLPEGTHKITLLSPKDRIAKTISVEIEAGKSARLAKDFTN
jgi:hypothetical protein